MSPSPEISRNNGKNSRGPVTEHGKAISARNSTRHGVLAKQPPLLVSEDLESFQGIMQGLIDEYQPQNSTEHLLVQQVAMGWLRLHRLWNVEAAIANKEVLEAQKGAKYLGVLSDLLKDETAIQQATAASKGLQNPEVFARYERHINHTLEKALDRLAAIKEQRNNGDSIGSFGQADILEMLKKVARERRQQADLTDAFN